MNTYAYRVVLSVTVEAFDEHDSDDLIKDTFQDADLCGIQVNDFEVTDFEMLD